MSKEEILKEVIRVAEKHKVDLGLLFASMLLEYKEQNKILKDEVEDLKATLQRIGK